MHTAEQLKKAPSRISS